MQKRKYREGKRYKPYPVAYYTNTGEAEVNFPELLNEAKKGGEKAYSVAKDVKRWWDTRKERKFTKLLEEAKLKGRENELLRKIEALKAEQERMRKEG